MTSLDFTDPERQRMLARAHDLIVDAYRILIDDVGLENPADNQVLRETTICSRLGLVWTGDRGGVDALDPDGEEVEIKTTRLKPGSRNNFPTSRYVSPTVIERFRNAGWWIFGVFNRYEELVALYRVDAADMQPLIEELERRMHQLQTANQPYQNNPKIPLNSIRDGASRLYLDGRYRERQDPGRGWLIELGGG